MSKKQYKVPVEVKKDILKRIKEGGVPVSKVAEEHGITTTTIYNWLGNGAKAAPTWSEYNKIRRERDEFLRIIGDLTVKLSVSQKKSW